MRKVEILWELPKCDIETQREQMLLEKNGADRCSVATNLQFVKTQYLQSSIKQRAIKWGMPVITIL